MLSLIKGRVREIRSALWFRPAAYCLFMVVLSAVIAILDTRLPEAFTSWMPDIEVAMVTDLLRLLAGSMLTVATVTLSVLMLVLSLAAGQASPRTVPELMADKVTQNALGTFLATFVFALVSLIVMGIGAVSGPGVTATFAVALLLIASAVRYLVQWIHHVADTMKLNRVIERIHDQSRNVLEKYLRLGGRPNPENEAPDGEFSILVYPSRTGYVQLVDTDKLDRLAERHGLYLRLKVHEGSFVQPRVPIMVRTAGDAGEDDGDLHKDLASILVTGSERSPAGDPLLGFELLAEIASRALSPGVNDPQTALVCIDYLGSLLIQAGVVGPGDYPGPLTEGGRVRLVRPQFDNLLQRAFRPLVRDGSSNAEVMLAILRTLTLVVETTDPAYADRLCEEGERVVEYGLAALHLDADKDSLRAAAEDLQAATAAARPLQQVLRK